MKNLLLLIVFSLCAMGLNAQSTLEELQSQKAELEEKRAAAQAEADGYSGEIASIQDELDKLAGWIKGFGGNIGFNFNNSDNWVANPNPNSSSSSLNVTLTAFANKKGDDFFWNNKAIASKSWQDVNIVEDEDGPGLFDQSTSDILNLSSLYGRNLSNSLALSGLAELNTSIENILEPGTLDFGVGATYTGIENLVLVVHPLNYNITFPSEAAKALGDDISTTGALGAKIRADYANEFSVNGRKLLWSSTFTGFFPYSDTAQIVPDSEGNDFEAGLTNYTWINTLSFDVWKGIGVGISMGLRNADLEDADKNQKFFSLGLTYVL